MFEESRVATFGALRRVVSNCLRATGFVLLVLGLAGCVKPPPKGGVRLEYYLWGEGVQAQCERKLLDEFERENPDIQVELTTVTGNYNEKMQALIVGGILPDVMSVDINAYYEWADRGILLDTTDLMAASEREQGLTFMPIVPQQLRYRDRYYCVPNGMCGVIPELNVAVFERAGVPLPTPEEFTWEWVARHIPKFSRRAGYPNAPAEVIGSIPDMTSLLQSFGGRIFDDPRHPRRVLVNSPEALQMAEFVRRITATRGLVSRAEATTSSNWGTDWDMFLRGQMVWFVMGIWATPRAWGESTDTRWEVRPFPAGPTGLRITANGAQLMGGGAKTKHPAETKRLLRFMLSEQAIKLRVATGAFMPLYRELLGREGFVSPNWPVSMPYFYETMELDRSQLPVYGPGVGQLRRIIDSRLSQLAGDRDRPAEEILQVLEDEIYRWLDRQKLNGFYREEERK